MYYNIRAEVLIIIFVIRTQSTDPLYENDKFINND